MFIFTKQFTFGFRELYRSSLWYKMIEFTFLSQIVVKPAYVNQIKRVYLYTIMYVSSK